MDKQILLINDITEMGKVALSAMVPVLSYMGFPVSSLPTALISNTLDYGRYDMLETTAHMRATFKVWGELGFSFNAIATGLMMSEEQVDLVSYYCSQYNKEETCILVDPVMGDEGRLYSGLSGDLPRIMRKMVPVASVTVPNYTEACLLTKTPYHREPVPLRDLDLMVDRLCDMGARSVSITSCLVQDRGPCVVGYDYILDERFCLPFTIVNARFPGTGDLYAAVLLGRLLQDQMMESSTQSAMDAVSGMLLQSRHQKDTLRGLPVEQLLEVIDQ